MLEVSFRHRRHDSNGLQKLADQRYRAWNITESEAVPLGGQNPENGLLYCKAEAGHFAIEVLRQRHQHWFDESGNLLFPKAALAPGQFYPRIARPVVFAEWEFDRRPPLRQKTLTSLLSQKVRGKP